MQISWRLAGLADGRCPVAEAHAFGSQAAQERLANPFLRRGAVLFGGER
jgi:hypothetical protein